MTFLIVNRFFGGAQIPTGRMARDVAQSLVEAGHEVVVLMSDGMYGGVKNEECPLTDETLKRVRLEIVPMIRRLPRVLSWMWFLWCARSRIPRLDWDVCILMTDPPLLPLIAPKAAALRRRVVVWMMDLYPEALAAAGRLSESGYIYRLIFRSRRKALEKCDLVVCLGEGQKARLAQEGAKAVRTVVVPPWDSRAEIGVSSESSLQKLALYAGNLGEAHGYLEILEAAEHLPSDWTIRFAIRGAKQDGLIREIRQRKWRLMCGAGGVFQYKSRGAVVEISGYASDAETPELLASARVHLITMSPGWEGVVVPSKLYGCLRTGRPTLFIGPESSDTACQIRENNWGAVLSSGSHGENVAAAILNLGSRETRHFEMRNGAQEMADHVRKCGEN